jgi:hypothetical protein
VFVFGHLVTIADAGIFPALDPLGGEEFAAFLLPDIVSCHDWAYDCIWGLRPGDRVADCVRAHMVGDGFIHYGDGWRGVRQRRGFAYRRMGLVSSRYESFFEQAEANGWLAEVTARRDSRRGWAHTLVEYSVDQHLADTRRLDDSFVALRAAGAAVTSDGLGRLLEVLGAQVSKPFPAQPSRYLGVITRAETPDEFHLRGLAAKFGLREDAPVLDWLRRLLRSVVAGVGTEELDGLIRRLTEVLEDGGGCADPVPRRWPGPARVAP